MKISDRFIWSTLTYLVSVFVVGPLTFLSWLIAFAHDEGTINETVGTMGYYAFMAFRFPTHYMMQWLNIEGDYFFSGLLVNIIINSAIATWIVITIMTRKGKFKAFE